MSTITQGIAWNDNFKLGNEQIDSQHKKLFELLSEFITACLDGSDAENIQETLNFLVDYTVIHFNSEEELQLLYKYPDYEKHKQLHENFKVTVGELIEKFNAKGSSTELSLNVSKTIVRWLVSHIMQEDKKIGEHIRKTANK